MPTNNQKGEVQEGWNNNFFLGFLEELKRWSIWLMLFVIMGILWWIFTESILVASYFTGLIIGTILQTLRE